LTIANVVEKGKRSPLRAADPAYGVTPKFGLGRLLVLNLAVQFHILPTVSKMAHNDFIMTIESDSEDPCLLPPVGKSKLAEGEDAVLNADFTFDLVGEFGSIFAHDEVNNITVNGSSTVCALLLLKGPL
jgi:hypothetical protein